MSEMQMTNDVEIEDFTDELSDEALDRADDISLRLCLSNCRCLTAKPER